MKVEPNEGAHRLFEFLPSGREPSIFGPSEYAPLSEYRITTKSGDLKRAATSAHEWHLAYCIRGPKVLAVAGTKGQHEGGSINYSQ